MELSLGRVGFGIEVVRSWGKGLVIVRLGRVRVMGVRVSVKP